MADIKLTALPSATVVANGDLLYLVHDPTGAPVSQKTTVGALLALAAPPLPTAALNQVLVSQGAGVQPVFSATLTLGPNAANTGGPIRLENNAYIMWRDGGNTGNTSGIKIDSTNNLIAGTNFYPDNTFLNLGSNTKRWMNVWVGTSVAIGANGATVGDIRLHAAGAIWARNAANTANIQLLSVSADALTLGVAGNPLAISGQTIAFNVTPTAPTAPPGTNDTQLATTAFVKAATTGGGAVAAHQATHRPGGIDVLVNNAWTDQTNVFSLQQIFNASWPQAQFRGTDQIGFDLFNTAGAANQKHWHLFAYTDRFFFRAMDDAGTAMLNDPMTVARGGDVVINSVAGGPQLQLMDNAQPGDLRRWRIQNIGQQLQFHATNDAVTANTATITIDRSGRMGGLKKIFLDGTTGPESSQLEVKGGVHPAIILHDPSQAADVKKARLVYYQQQLRLDFVNDAESANVGGMVTVNRDGTLTAAAVSAGNYSGTTGTITNFNCTNITCSAINNSGRQVNSGGVTGAYNLAPLEIAMTGNPRIAFHWPGMVASQLGMDSSGNIRTFDNPGTGYATFLCGNLTAYGGFATNGITCTTINTQGYAITTGAGGITCGSLNVTTATSYMQSLICTNINTQGYNVTTGSLNTTDFSATRGSIGSVSFPGDVVSGGYPTMRAAASAHLVINAVPLYLQYDVPGNSVLCYGPFNMTRGDTMSTAHVNPITDNTYSLGTTAQRWYTGYFALPPLASGYVGVVTAGGGALYYASSDRKSKKNIRPSVLERSKKILDLIPSYYQDKNAEENGPSVLGLMTDEVPMELEDLVTRFDRPEGPVESVHYDRVAMHLLVVMKDMQRRIDELEARIH